MLQIMQSPPAVLVRPQPTGPLRVGAVRSASRCRTPAPSGALSVTQHPQTAWLVGVASADANRPAGRAGAAGLGHVLARGGEPVEYVIRANTRTPIVLRLSTGTTAQELRH
jgi:hypothetical protein